MGIFKTLLLAVSPHGNTWRAEGVRIPDPAMQLLAAPPTRGL